MPTHPTLKTLVLSIACAAVLVACESPALAPDTPAIEDAPAPDLAVTYNSQDYFEFIFPALPPCLNEELAFSGRVHVVDMDGNRSGFHLNPSSLVGVGVVSGTKYYGHGPTRSFVVNTPSGNTIVQAIDFGALVVKKGQPNVRFHFQTHLTINANGDITADHSKDVVECQ